jgi:NAD(P)-binding Rossmann-like domain
MKRRDFLLSAAALAAGGGAVFAAGQRISASVEYPGRELGHWLRDATSLPQPTETLDTEVLIAGSGIAGLTAAWRLAKRGARDVLMVSGPELYGNAAAGSDGDLVYPTGAHYLPLPSMESTHVREMLHEFGVIQRDPFSEHPTYDERFLVHGPAERVLYKGVWQEGYLPADGVGSFERGEHARFFSMVDWYSAARGGDGRRAFAVPLEMSSTDSTFRELDRISFRAWLESVDLRSPTLLWYLDYCCRDDYGRHLDEVSAWAGLHYFCSRDGLAANAERGAVLTWPQGLSELAMRLDKSAGTADRRIIGSVAYLRSHADGVEAHVLKVQGGNQRMVRVRAKYAVAAMPLHVLQRICPELKDHGFGPHDVPRYAPWMVSNFLMRAFPSEQAGVPLSWDNVVYKEPGLGYVVSTHQDIRLSRPDRSAFTAYYSFSDLEPEPARRWLDEAHVDDLARTAGRDLSLAYGWRLPWCVERLAITVRAHAMAVPEPGFLSNAARLALRGTSGPLFFAHSDLSGLSVFEEAAWWGYQAAERIVTQRK